MTTAAVEYRQALSHDYSTIVQLNSANFIANLSEDQRKDGFLSAVFTLEQTAAMAEDLGTTVAIVDGVLAGFLCAFRNDFNHGSPVVAKMIESYDRMWFEGKLLSRYNTYAYGPVCIDRAYRRKGLLRGLYEAQKRELAGKFEVGVALIARNNPHSVQAHVAGLGMTEVGEFEVNGIVFATVAFRLS
ncbi:MAG: acetyltransferase domain protein [Deltaproteobacteria bacterium]|nr:acetyltransferase domain protein [Deltaproteobacteria bacterium]